jgi:hypothetical protein
MKIINNMIKSIKMNNNHNKKQNKNKNNNII